MNKGTAVFLVIEDADRLNDIRKLIENEHGEDTHIIIVPAKNTVFAPNATSTELTDLVIQCRGKSNGRKTFVYFYGKLPLNNLKTAWRAGILFRRLITNGTNKLVIRRFGEVHNGKKVVITA